ncbi:LysR family transcriptional regulator [Streptomyces sp. NPDC050400]|uniref:LysR family transcriptional regulator n=1 Tax=Streptomyces sp. NPDC050400 TaxID=3365610 RepID=UPI00378C2939
MEIRWIEAFLAVADELHFGRAAERLRMAQSPLSQTIRKLERQLGTPLFERSTRSVSLTSAGRAFLPHARRIVSELDLARRAARSGQSEVYGQVTIGFSGTLNHRTLPPLTRRVRELHPGVELTLVGGVVTEQAVLQLKQGRLDLSFVGLPVRHAGITARAIAVEPFGAVLPLGHPLAEADQVALADLADEPFVAVPRHPGSAYREVLLGACLAAGFRPAVTQEVVDPYLILSLVAAGTGVSLAPECLRPVMPEGAVYVPLAPPVPELRSGIAWREDHDGEALRAVLAVAAEVLPEPAG